MLFYKNCFHALLNLLSNSFCRITHINPIALRKAKIVYNFGLSECNMVKLCLQRSSYFDISSTIIGMLAELQIRGSIEDNSKIIFLISQGKHIL